MSAVDDIVSLLQDLGSEMAAEVISKFMTINPHVEYQVAAKMAPSAHTQSTATTTDTPATSDQGPSSSLLTSFIPNLFSMASSFGADLNHKMIFAVNMELNMGRGKQCAQVAHAALGLYLKVQESSSKADKDKLDKWLFYGQKKIVVRAQNLKQLLSIQEEANKASLANILISDAGCTQIAPGSKTVLSIFGTSDEVDRVTGALKLL